MFVVLSCVSYALTFSRLFIAYVTLCDPFAHHMYLGTLLEQLAKVGALWRTLLLIQYSLRSSTSL